MPPQWYLAASVITGGFYGVLGGLVCAIIARGKSRQALFGLMLPGELAGVASTGAFWGKVPLWYSLALLVVYPPAVWFGGKLRVAK